MNSPRPAADSGFGLLEVLVALLVLSLGSLGLLRLSIMSAARQHQAVLQHQALAALNDLEARVRVNPAGLPAYAGPPASRTCSSTVTPSLPCEPEVMAAHDLAEWRARHLASLPRAQSDLRLLGDGETQTLAIELTWSTGRWNGRITRVVGP